MVILISNDGQSSSYPSSFQLEWYGLVESKVRHLVGNLEREAIDLAHVWPKTYPSLEPGKETRCCYWFIGLQLKTARKDDGTPQSLDLTVPIRKFTEVVMSSATTTVGMWREGMKVEAVYKRRKELAHYIPPDERYKLKAEKASRSQASLAAASRQPSSEQQQQQQGLKRRNSSVEAASAAAVPTEQPTTGAAEDGTTENGNSASSAPDTSNASSSVESRNDINSGSTAAVPSKENTASSNSRESSPPPVKRQKSPPPPTPTTAMTTAVSSTEATKSIVENSNGVQVT